MSLQIADDQKLPLDAVTETIGWIGNRGSGKTHGAKVMAEEMLKAGAQVAVLDPVDAWYGLRYGRDKGTSGLPVYVFGGQHGDAPLEATAGKLLADVVVERGISAVFSMRHLPKGQQRRFVKDFAEQLYLRKGEDQYRTPVHVFIEEAHGFAPQTMPRGEEIGCLGAIQDLVLQGRGSGIGVSLVTQRVAMLSKSVLELAEVLFAFRTTGPNARKALKEWFAAQDGEDHLSEFIAGIASLPRGECWLWSPGYLNLFERVGIRQAETFDSSATPKPGKARPNPKGTAAELDLGELGDAIRETVERAEANDPRKLQARVRELEAELAKRPELTQVEIRTEHVEVPVLDVVVLDAMRDLALDASDRLMQEAHRLADESRKLRAGAAASPAAKTQKIRDMEQVSIERVLPAAAREVKAIPRERAEIDVDGVKLGKRERLILGALAQYPEGRTQRQLALLCGYSAKASTVGAGISTLRSAGLVEPSGLPRPTPDGLLVARAAGIEELPTGPALLDYWRGQFGAESRERKILDLLLDDPKGDPRLSNDEIAEAVGFNRGTSTVGAGVSKLRTLGLVAQGSPPRLSEEFMEAIR